MEAYHKSHYFPGNAVVYLVGDLELSQMEAQLTQVTRMGDDDWLMLMLGHWLREGGNEGGLVVLFDVFLRI